MRRDKRNPFGYLMILVLAVFGLVVPLSMTFAQTVDTAFPVVSVSPPPAAANLQLSVSIEATAMDDTSIAGVQFELNGANLGTEDTSVPYIFTWDTTTVPNGSYALSAVARDSVGKITRSASVTVGVNNDYNPPIITDVRATEITNTSAAISWKTDELSDSRVEYGPSTGYGFLHTSTPLLTSHFLVLNNLMPSTLYHFRVKSKDSLGHDAPSTDLTFTTLTPAVPPPSPTPLQIPPPPPLVPVATTTPTPIPPPAPSAVPPSAQPSPVPVPQAGRSRVTVSLYRGLRNDHVKTLQQFLIRKDFLATGNDTGFYGGLTEQAVKSFQCKEGLVCEGSPSSTGYGRIGPKTLKRLNESLDAGM